MADRRRATRKNQREDEPPADLSKEDEKIAKFVRFNCPTKTGNFEGNEVHYFTGKNAVDKLIESKKYGGRRQGAAFRASCGRRRLPDEPAATRPVLPGAHPRAEEEGGSAPSEEGRAGDRLAARAAVLKADRSDREGETGESGAEQKNKPEKDEKEEEEKKEKRKKKTKLVAHDIQTFNDDSDVYVWIFDPTPLRNYIIGLGMVFGTILACLFPLWPDWLRLGVYYLSVTGIALFGLLLGVAIARTILFYVIYALSFGKHKLWILPNLTEDCGFFVSFVPVYTYEYVSAEASAKERRRRRARKKKDEEAEPLVDNEEGEEEAEPQPSTAAAKPKKANRKAKRAPEPADQPEASGDLPNEPTKEADEAAEPKRKDSQPSSSADDDFEIVGRDR
ncbi:Translocation protein 1 [Aphelenchoides fujianensis]|nr:Translocation protein 1 [Aphelenchoides fujianensis]